MCRLKVYVYYGLLDLVVKLMIILSCCSKGMLFWKVESLRVEHSPPPGAVYRCSILIIVTYPGLSFLFNTVAGVPWVIATVYRKIMKLH